jgi:hypothetical protein
MKNSNIFLIMFLVFVNCAFFVVALEEDQTSEAEHIFVEEGQTAESSQDFSPEEIERMLNDLKSFDYEKDGELAEKYLIKKKQYDGRDKSLLSQLLLNKHGGDFNLEQGDIVNYDGKNIVLKNGETYDVDNIASDPRFERFSTLKRDDGTTTIKIDLYDQNHISGKTNSFLLSDTTLTYDNIEDSTKLSNGDTINLGIFDSEYESNLGDLGFLDNSDGTTELTVKKIEGSDNTNDVSLGCESSQNCFFSLGNVQYSLFGREGEQEISSIEVRGDTHTCKGRLCYGSIQGNDFSIEPGHSMIFTDTSGGVKCSSDGGVTVSVNNKKIGELLPGEGPTTALKRVKGNLPDNYKDYLMELPNGEFKKIGELTDYEVRHLSVGAVIKEPKIQITGSSEFIVNNDGSVDEVVVDEYYNQKGELMQSSITHGETEFESSGSLRVCLIDCDPIKSDPENHDGEVFYDKTGFKTRGKLKTTVKGVETELIDPHVKTHISTPVIDEEILLEEQKPVVVVEVEKCENCMENVGEVGGLEIKSDGKNLRVFGKTKKKTDINPVEEQKSSVVLTYEKNGMTYVLVDTSKGQKLYKYKSGEKPPVKTLVENQEEPSRISGLLSRFKLPSIIKNRRLSDLRKINIKAGTSLIGVKG